MKKLVILTFLICSVVFVTQAEDFPEIKGYKQTSEVRSYSPDNLWEYINGAADQFLDYDFQILRSCDLSAKGLSVSVDIYEMGTPLNAFGIYTNERSLDPEKLSIGSEAIISPPYQALLLKGNYYIKVDVLEGEISENNGVPLLNAIAAALKGSENYPGDLQFLPEENIIEGSQRYSSRGFLGLKELNNCIYADYLSDEKKDFQYFFINTGSKISENRIWDMLSSKWKQIEYKDKKILVKKVPYQGIVGVVQIRQRIYGVSGFEAESEMIRKIAVLLEKF